MLHKHGTYTQRKEMPRGPEASLLSEGNPTVKTSGSMGKLQDLLAHMDEDHCTTTLVGCILHTR